MKASELIITSMVKYGEFDCVAKLLTKEFGRLSVFCRSGLKSSKRRPSVMQAPAKARGLIQFKKEGLSSLSELDIGDYTFDLALNLRNFALANYACELVEVFTPEQDACEEIYDLLDAFLKRCSKTQELKTSEIRLFEYRLLDLCGLLGNYDREYLQNSKHLNDNDLKKMAQVFTGHLRQHKQKPLKSLAFFKQVANKAT